ncbi:TspO/MBR family protein [Flavobacterium sp.]|uniref:TspO/MBR family protein n=1 Tax=Flavobacterium sp. TaxID=239 RepID=UPI003B9BEAF5
MKIGRDLAVKSATLIATTLGIGFLVGQVTRPGIETWFVFLEKPFFNPPNWLFAPVWSVLYVFMAIAAARVWSNTKSEVVVIRKALLFWWIQLALNTAWSFLFFGLKNPLLALVEIVLLELLIYETYLQFRKIDVVSAKLLIPYMIWVAFAAILNASIWWLN